AVGFLGPHDAIDGVGRFVAAGGALVGGGAVLDDGLGVVGTAGIAAAAAVGAGQAVGDLRDARVLIHGHKLGCQHQDEAAGQAQHHQHHDSQYDRVHLFLPLSYRIALMMFSTRPPKPIQLSEVMAAATSVMGRPLKLSGGSAFSTRWRTPQNSSMATKKPTPAPAAQTSAWANA